MQKNITEFDFELKKKCIKKWMGAQSKYKRVTIGKILYVLSAVVLFSCVLCVVLHTHVPEKLATNLLAGAGVGVIIAAFPFGIGRGMIKSTIKECGNPFNMRSEKFINITEKGLQFGYHNLEERYAESVNVYQLLFEDMNAVRYDAEMCIITIIGSAELLVYDDLSMHRLNSIKSQRKFYGNTPYSFLLVIDEREEVAEYLNSRAVHRRG
jgi:hypothetical protein